MFTKLLLRFIGPNPNMHDPYGKKLLTRLRV